MNVTNSALLGGNITLIATGRKDLLWCYVLDMGLYGLSLCESLGPCVPEFNQQLMDWVGGLFHNASQFLKHLVSQFVGPV